MKPRDFHDLFSAKGAAPSQPRATPWVSDSPTYRGPTARPILSANGAAPRQPRATPWVRAAPWILNGMINRGPSARPKCRATVRSGLQPSNILHRQSPLGRALPLKGATMKKEWETKKLVDVATLQRGFDLPTQDRSSGDVTLVTSSGISDTVSKSAVLFILVHLVSSKARRFHLKALQLSCPEMEQTSEKYSIMMGNLKPTNELTLSMS